MDVEGFNHQTYGDAVDNWVVDAFFVGGYATQCIGGYYNLPYYGNADEPTIVRDF